MPVILRTIVITCLIGHSRVLSEILAQSPIHRMFVFPISLLWSVFHAADFLRCPVSLRCLDLREVPLKAVWKLGAPGWALLVSVACDDLPEACHLKSAF